MSERACATCGAAFTAVQYQGNQRYCDAHKWGTTAYRDRRSEIDQREKAWRNRTPEQTARVKAAQLAYHLRLRARAPLPDTLTCACGATFERPVSKAGQFTSTRLCDDCRSVRKEYRATLRCADCGGVSGPFNADTLCPSCAASAVYRKTKAERKRRGYAERGGLWFAAG